MVETIYQIFSDSRNNLIINGLFREFAILWVNEKSDFFSGNNNSDIKYNSNINS